jgi:hypothetical protein
MSSLPSPGVAGHFELILYQGTASELAEIIFPKGLVSGHGFSHAAKGP